MIWLTLPVSWYNIICEGFTAVAVSRFLHARYLCRSSLHPLNLWSALPHSHLGFSTSLVSRVFFYLLVPIPILFWSIDLQSCAERDRTTWVFFFSPFLPSWNHCEYVGFWRFRSFSSKSPSLLCSIALCFFVWFPMFLSHTLKDSFIYYRFIFSCYLIIPKGRIQLSNCSLSLPYFIIYYILSAFVLRLSAIITPNLSNHLIFGFL